jgi:hypothetical protein
MAPCSLVEYLAKFAGEFNFSRAADPDSHIFELLDTDPDLEYDNTVPTRVRPHFRFGSEI